MEEQIKKLKRIKSSCKAVKTVSLIIFIICVVATVLTLIGSIVFFASNGKYDDEIMQAVSEGHLSFSFGLGFIQITENDLETITQIQSDVPAIQEIVKNSPVSMTMGFYLLGISFLCAVTSIPCFLFYSIFSLIIKEDTPFSDKVVRRFLISFIILSVVIAMSVGIGFGLLAGFVTWTIYTILDYGKTLQIQSDETL